MRNNNRNLYLDSNNLDEEENPKSYKKQRREQGI